MALTTVDVLYPLLTGLSVVAVTVLGDRLGGRAGGLLATAPVTTTAAHIVIATSVPADLAAARVLQGIAALLASTYGIVAFFYIVKYTRGRPDSTRLAAGLLTYAATFLGLTLLFAHDRVPILSGYIILFATHASLAFSFMREPIPVLRDYTPRPASRTARELTLRFTAGAAVVALIRLLVHLSPPLAGALAVVPAVFVVSITIMGLNQNAPFAARAAQAGLFGTTAVALFVLTIAAALTLGANIYAATPLAWLTYSGALLTLSNLHSRLYR